ncbi:MAG: flagellin [Acidobacteriota bacterium]
MAFTINTNIASLQAQNSLRVNGDFQSKTINRVTSGLRIVNSGDDAAGLAIANGYRSDEAVLSQGIRNANDGLAQLQTADGGINNISQLLDRARTLATQSASGAFTGDRGVLNSEFESVITEIDRQAQAVGLNQGGTFAKALSVFIGGGKSSNGINATANGSVALDLSTSTVDSTSLGLKGVQAVGVAGTDIGAGSANTSVSKILANTANTASLATPGYTTFVVKGPGFDGNGIKINVNTASVSGTSDLVEAVNAAIAAAETGGTQQGTALKNANISAAVHTDASGKQQLVFKSSTTAFQVQARDGVANALLGNFERNAVASGTDTVAYADTSANAILSFKIDGGSQINVTVTSAKGTSKGQIVADLNADATFAASATAHLDGNKIVIKSKDTGADSSVAVVTTALNTALGLSGTASAADAATGADFNVQVQAAGTLAAGANTIGSDAAATATVATTNLNIYLTVGSSGAQTLALNVGTSLTKEQIADDINAKISANGNFTGANNATVTAKVIDNKIVLEAGKPGATLTVAGGANNANTLLGFTAGAYSDHLATKSDSVTLRFQGSGLTSPVDITLDTFAAGTTTAANILSDLQSKIVASGALGAAGISLSTSSVGNNLVFTSNKGEQFQVVASGDSANLLGLGSYTAGTGNAVDYTSITAGSSYSTTAADGTASFEVSFNGGASSAHVFAADLSAGDATAASQTGTVVYTAGVVDLTGGANLVLRVDGGTNITVALGASATTSIATILTNINTALGANGSATLNGSGNIVLSSASKGYGSAVEVVNVAGGSDAETLTALGLTGATVTHGTNASEANVIQQLNDDIAANGDLVAAGLEAQDNGAGKIQIVSNNGTYFRLNAYGAGNAGFTHAGATYTGNIVGGAPATSPYVTSQGADASATLAYSDRLFGSDDQTVSITANDNTGAKHGLSITLRNDATARSQSIDQALDTINAALQQSNDSTLNRIVAVKDESGGAQSIKFLSTVRGFQVTVGGTPNSTGIAPPAGNQSLAETVGQGANADISDIEGAQAAVAAVAEAVSVLGRAQAVVGRGQNQFNFAINLAQSQLTNLAAAESRIRDADLAAESANLTKSQILLQAGIAALAQANSAPQQVLTLLRG